MAQDFIGTAFAQNKGIDTKKLRKPWMESKRMILGTVDNIEQAVDECVASGRYGLDLETSGLDHRIFNGRTKDYIVGFCISPDGNTGYYIPIMHDPDKYGQYNIPERFWRPAMERLTNSSAVARLHNGKFDQVFLENNGGAPLGDWDDPAKWEDSEILAYLRNNKSRSKELKELSKASTHALESDQCGGPGLGMEMIELYELFGHDKKSKTFKYDFSKLDPSNEASIWYGCSDAICTFLLVDLLSPSVHGKDSDGKTQSGIYKIEKMCIAATRWMEGNRIYIARDKVEELVRLGQKEWFDSIMEVYSEAEKHLGRDAMPRYLKILQPNFVSDDPTKLIDHQIETAEKQAADEATQAKWGVAALVSGEDQETGEETIVKEDGKRWPAKYDVGSASQIGVLFEELGIEGLNYTEKSGQVKTSKAEIERILEDYGDKYPFLSKIRRFRETQKALSTYLYPLLDEVEPSDNTVQVAFRAFKTDTGRFSTPSRDMDMGAKRVRRPGWPHLNLHSIPATYDPKKPECMLRLREVFAARPGRFIVAPDFSAVELRIITNLSREPKWVTEFFRCSDCDHAFDRGEPGTTPPAPPPFCPNCGSDKIGDLHSLTALEIFGKDSRQKPDWKHLRQRSKAVNFALCYGGGGKAVQRSTNCDENEGMRIKKQFDATFSDLKSWWSYQHDFVQKHGFVRTAFGRRCPAPDIFAAEDFFRAKAKRNAVNAPIQGSSADITKIAMALVYKECKKRGWLEKCRMIITMHDELVFEVDGDILQEVCEVIPPLMNRNKAVLGLQWPVPLTSDIEIGHDWTVPWNYKVMSQGKTRYIGDKEYKSKEKLPEGVNWNDLPSYPATLHSYFQDLYPGYGPPPEGTVINVPAEAPKKEPAPVVVEAPKPPAYSNGAEPKTSAPKATNGGTVNPVASSEVIEPTIIDGVFEYRIHARLTVETAQRLARLIHRCRNKGTARLRLITASGEDIDAWRDVFGDAPVKVNAGTFEALAKDAGL